MAEPVTRVPGHPRHVIGFAVASLVFLLAAVIGGRSHISALTQIGLYGVIILGIGGAPLALLRGIDIWTRLSAAIIIGFGTVLCGGAAMADIRGAWQPIPLAIGLGLLAMALHTLGVVRAWPLLDDTGATIARGRRGLRPTRAGVTSVALSLVGSVLWLVPALTQHDPEPGIGGLLTVMSPAWYVGLALVTVALMVGRHSGRCAALAAFSFGLATTVTPAFVYGAPSENAAAKQMQLTAYVLAHHHIAVTTGIFPAYSALFSGMAWMCALVGVRGLTGSDSLLQIATFWPVLLVILRVIELRLLAGRLLTTGARRWVAVMLVLLTDSLIYYYYSPQAIGYILAIAVLALTIRGRTAQPLSNWWVFGLVLFAGIALAVTHELSPYLAAGAFFVLAVFGQAPWRLFPAMFLPALAWAGVVHKAVSSNFSFGTLFDLENFHPPKTPSAPGLDKLPIVGYQSHALLAALLILIGLAAIGFFANIRTRRVWGYGLCPAAGLVLIAINPYGNEGIFRATLFAIPWLAILAMQMPQPGRRVALLRGRRRLGIAGSIVMLALLATFVVAEYGMDASNEVRKSDLEVADFLTTPASGTNAFALGIEPTFEDDTDSQYTPADGIPFTLTFTPITWPEVATEPSITTNHPTPASVAALVRNYLQVAAEKNRRARRGPEGPHYIVWSQSIVDYAQVFAIQAPAVMDQWLAVLEHSQLVHLVHRWDETYLFAVNGAEIPPALQDRLQALLAELSQHRLGMLVRTVHFR